MVGRSDRKVACLEDDGLPLKSPFSCVHPPGGNHSAARVEWRPLLMIYSRTLRSLPASAGDVGRACNRDGLDAFGRV